MWETSKNVLGNVQINYKESIKHVQIFYKAPKDMQDYLAAVKSEVLDSQKSKVKNNISEEKIPHTGDTNSLDRCG